MIIKTKIHLNAETNQNGIDLPDPALYSGATVQSIDETGIVIRLGGVTDETLVHQSMTQLYSWYVPSPIRMEQFWLGLNAISPELFTIADQAVEANPLFRRACSAPTIRRDSAMLEQMRVSLGVAHELLDQVFRAGVSVVT